MSPRPSVALVLLGLLGCDRAPVEPPAPPPPPPVVDASAASADVAVPADDVAAPLDAPPPRPTPPVGPFDAGGPADPARSCSIITRLQRRGMVHASQQLDASAAPIAAALRGCHPTLRGAWGLLLEDACATATPLTFNDSDEAATVAARVVVAHVDAAGTVTTFLPDTSWPPSADCGPITHDAPGDALGRLDALAALVRVDPASTFDFDGDGDGEFIVRFTRRHPQDHPEEDGVSLVEESRTLILKALPDGPAELPGTGAAQRVEDVDHDGRPDLRLPFPYGSDEPVAWDTALVTLVAHSLPGGAFTTTDAVAARATLAQCAPLRRTSPGCDAGAGCDAGPSRVTVVARNTRGHVDIVASQNQAICASLRGVPAEELAAAVTADCGTQRSDQRRCGQVMGVAQLAGTSARAFPAGVLPVP